MDWSFLTPIVESAKALNFCRHKNKNKHWVSNSVTYFEILTRSCRFAMEFIFVVSKKRKKILTRSPSIAVSQFWLSFRRSGQITRQSSIKSPLQESCIIIWALLWKRVVQSADWGRTDARALAQQWIESTTGSCKWISVAWRSVLDWPQILRFTKFTAGRPAESG